MSIVVGDAELRGTVTLGARTVVHPRACLVGEAGPIVVGDETIIEERVTIINERATPLLIGSGCRIASAAQLESVESIGDGVLIEAKAYIGKGVRIGKECIVAAGVRVDAEGTIVQDRTVVFGSGALMRPLDETTVKANKALHSSHVAYVADLLPRFHNLQGPSGEKLPMNNIGGSM